MSDFKRALKVFLKYEGGYSNHKNDPGGATNKGITQITYNDYRQSHGARIRNVRDISDQEVADIYEHRYWEACGADKMAWPLSLVVCDAAINCGVSRAVRWAEEAKGDIKKFNELRRQHYKNIIAKNSKLRVFAKGWENRVRDIERIVKEG
jgi:lysozyme family protein